jgi:bifunctional DNase/RNase
MHPVTTGPALALPAVLAAGAALVLAGSPGPGAGGPPPDLLEMEVMGVVPLEDGEANLLVLGRKDAPSVLTMVIGRAEASAIDAKLRRATPPRPMTHDLLGSAIGELGGKVERVEIVAYRDSVFLARVRVRQGTRSLSLDARPSDSVALALRAGAPIFAARKVVEEQGISRADLEKMRRRGEAPARPPRVPPRIEGTQSL